MKTIKQYTNEELQLGIGRCNARLSGVMNKGLLTDDMTRSALKQYKAELLTREVKCLEFSY